MGLFSCYCCSVFTLLHTYYVLLMYKRKDKLLPSLFRPFFLTVAAILLDIRVTWNIIQKKKFRHKHTNTIVIQHFHRFSGACIINGIIIENFIFLLWLWIVYLCDFIICYFNPILLLRLLLLPLPYTALISPLYIDIWTITQLVEVICVRYQILVSNNNHIAIQFTQ